MHAPLPRLVSLSLYAILVCACGQSTDESSPTNSAPPASQADRDACSLLTADDIQSVTGTAPGAPVPNLNGCDWPAADGSNEFLVQLTVAATNLRSYEEYAANFRKEMNGDPSAVVHRIDGAGDFAIGFNDMPMVQIYQGSSFVQVMTFRNEEKHALELAERALARLE